MINFLTVLVGILLARIGIGIYLIANLGPRPRDELMTGLQKNSQYPISAIRIFIETSVVIIGFILGGYSSYSYNVICSWYRAIRGAWIENSKIN